MRADSQRLPTRDVEFADRLLGFASCTGFHLRSDWLLIAQSLRLLRFGTQGSKGVPAIHGVLHWRLRSQADLVLILFFSFEDVVPLDRLHAELHHQIIGDRISGV